MRETDRERERERVTHTHRVRQRQRETERGIRWWVDNHTAPVSVKASSPKVIRQIFSSLLDILFRDQREGYHIRCSITGWVTGRWKALSCRCRCRCRCSRSGSPRVSDRTVPCLFFLFSTPIQSNKHNLNLIRDTSLLSSLISHLVALQHIATASQ